MLQYIRYYADVVELVDSLEPGDATLRKEWCKMKQIGKVLKIILVFFATLLCISLVWHIVSMATLQQGETPIPFIDYVLYLLGFGDLDVKDHYLQTVFSILGLFSVTLLSSVFTVNLFEMRNKVRIAKEIKIISKRTAVVQLHAARRDIYNLTATLIVKCGSDITTQEQYFPLVTRKECLKLYFDISPGTPLYKYLRTVYRKGAEEPQLILTAVYTDIESGQTYTMAKKYQYGPKEQDFIFEPSDSLLSIADFEESIRDWITNNTFRLNLAAVQPCNAEDITISCGHKDEQTELAQNEIFSAQVNMSGNKAYTADTFTMAVLKDLAGNDWTKYYDLGCALKFLYRVDGNIAVTMELKYGDHASCVETVRLMPNERFDAYSLHLHQLDREKLRSVAELCFTVFYRDVDAKDPTGSFSVRDCVLEVESPEKTEKLR